MTWTSQGRAQELFAFTPTSRFSRNQRVYYHDRAQNIRLTVKIVVVHTDDKDGVYYTILLPTGHEKQTVAHRLCGIPRDAA